MRPTPTQEEMDAFHRGERKASHEPDGSPEQHVGAQEQIPNAQTLKAAKAKAPKAVEHKPEVVPEVKAAEAEPARAAYKTREAKPKKDEDEKKD